MSKWGKLGGYFRPETNEKYYAMERKRKAKLEKVPPKEMKIKVGGVNRTHKLISKHLAGNVAGNRVKELRKSTRVRNAKVVTWINYLSQNKTRWHCVYVNYK